MARRNIFQGRKREYLSVSISTDADRALLQTLRQRARDAGVSLRRFVLDVLNDYLRGH